MDNPMDMNPTQNMACANGEVAWLLRIDPECNLSFLSSESGE